MHPSDSSGSPPAGWAAALLDAMPDATAVLDRFGTIVAVNAAWNRFSLDNGGDAGRNGVGVSYLDVCSRAAAGGLPDAAEVVVALQAVLAGETVDGELEYACPSPTVGRWFMLRITPVAGPSPGALVSHVNISRRKTAEQELERKASEDPLTRLANRTQFHERLSAALAWRPGRPPRPDVGLMYIDLDGFKPVNDTYGHAAGDEVLQAVAGRLRNVTRPQDTVARLGGDEFAVVAPRVNADALTGLAGRIRAALAEPHPIHGYQVVVEASVGTYLAAPGDNVADSVRRADEAMYAVKRARPSPATRP